MPVQELIRQRKKGIYSLLIKVMTALEMEEEIKNLLSDKLVTLKVKEAMRRRNSNHTLNQGIMRTLPVLVLTTIITVAFTTTLQMKIAKRMEDQVRQAGWKIDCHKTITATTIQGTLIPTEVFKFGARMLMAAPPIAYKEGRMLSFQKGDENIWEQVVMITIWVVHLQSASR